MERRRRCSTHTLSLLAILVERPRSWRYGYALSPILMRLSDRGLLDSKWEPSPERGRPPRHMYRLTSEGVAFARKELTDSSRKDRAAKLRGLHA